MKTLFTLALASACGAAAAQTPTVNAMPDGSRDMYIGLGVQSVGRYEGASERRVKVLPLLQVEWSNGIFLSGMSAGMHLSSTEGIEYGPLLALQTSRTAAGFGTAIGGISNSSVNGILPSGDGMVLNRKSVEGKRLDGVENVPSRLLGGGFVNYYLNPGLRLTNSVLVGAGRDSDGAFWNIGLQHLAGNIAPHHTLSLAAGLSLGNRSYMQSYFGVSALDALRSGNRKYTPGAGFKDTSASVRWNWTLSPSWMLSSNVRVTRLLGNAKNSPLVEHPTNLTVSTGLAYRF